MASLLDLKFGNAPIRGKSVGPPGGSFIKLDDVEERKSRDAHEEAKEEAQKKRSLENGSELAAFRAAQQKKRKVIPQLDMKEKRKDFQLSSIFKVKGKREAADANVSSLSAGEPLDDRQLPGSSSKNGQATAAGSSGSILGSGYASDDSSEESSGVDGTG
eukprot:TRINITY_DN69898_c0_g1_i1.p1 TRINITY_DN69898_c0_g1~~TRINITY_DN69898_c0_g1_i1.p1  ORF type:complete len:160 (-),score=46.03 TRINITY_DN69898_c0_g1_i1:132-611(-)